MDKRSLQGADSPSLPEYTSLSSRPDLSLDRRREELHRVARQRRTRRTLLVGAAGGTLGVAACVLLITVLTINGVLFAAPATNPDYPPIDGVACQATEMIAHHYHAHITLYINGSAVLIPADIGIAGITPKDLYPQPICFYWLHTHDTSGLIHIESPANQQFTLGDFLDIWSQKFSGAGVGGFPTAFSQTGWSIYINGTLQPPALHLRSIILKPHLLITLAYRSPDIRPDTLYDWGTY